MPTEQGAREVRRLLDEAESAAIAGEWGRARELAEAALGIDPGSATARAFVARAMVRSGQAVGPRPGVGRRESRNVFGWPIWVWATLGVVAYVVVPVGVLFAVGADLNARWDGPGGRCERVSSEFVRRLESRLDPGLSLRHVRAVRSEHTWHWYVSGGMEGLGLAGDEGVATWLASGGFDSPEGNRIYAMGSRALESSSWGEAPGHWGSDFDADDARAERARSCVLEAAG